MYVCICHAVTEDDVHGCIAAGACSPKEVRAACGMRPGCGSCTKRLCALVSQRRSAAGLVDALADLSDEGVVTAA
ncbi:bacterioferritin-associated ferredoxin [Actinomadura sp. HBU206391]|uniref:(2Fe-2S)-binding protein n=1 Tax=Actinomadura sp. HBU206391 TaxID=2731692 RepID=UPI00164FBCC3|nr:(2Fe-2S)-binding protein [Actinomadura sp. HBU206391]MBC6458649.1 (2Fe-2S)-binding protein [Actinomadura sp. HBU206391]